MVVPTAVPWTELTGEALEEFVYWLLDSMGARDLEWRAGGRKTTATDGGRDLQATFHVLLPDGEVDSQIWWIQAKGTSNTVAKSEVLEFLNLGKASVGVDVLVMATNGRYTNPTRDVVAEHNRAGVGPRLNLWDRESLMRHLVEHPSVAARVVPRALSLEGRLRAATERFWNELMYPNQRDLDEFWEAREQLEWSETGWFAVASGEAANGGFAKHPWAMVIPVDELIKVFITGAGNMMFLAARAWDGGYSTEPLEGALAYLGLAMLRRFDAADVVDLLVDPFQFVETDPNNAAEAKLPEVWHEYLMPPLLDRMQAQLARVCLADCGRVMADHLRHGEADESGYMWRFTTTGEPHTVGNEHDDRDLVVESMKEPCRAGLELVDPEGHCPLIADLPSSTEDLTEFLSDLRHIVKIRTEALSAH